VSNRKLRKKLEDQAKIWGHGPPRPPLRIAAVYSMSKVCQLTRPVLVVLLTAIAVSSCFCIPDCIFCI